jgi:hypothetical protein
VATFRPRGQQINFWQVSRRAVMVLMADPLGIRTAIGLQAWMQRRRTRVEIVLSTKQALSAHPKTFWLVHLCHALIVPCFGAAVSGDLAGLCCPPKASRQFGLGNAALLVVERPHQQVFLALFGFLHFLLRRVGQRCCVDGGD